MQKFEVSKAIPKLRWHLQQKARTDLIHSVLDAREVFSELIYDKVCNKSAAVTGRVDGALSQIVSWEWRFSSQKVSLVLKIVHLTFNTLNDTFHTKVRRELNLLTCSWPRFSLHYSKLAELKSVCWSKVDQENMFVLLMSTVMELYMICFATCEIYVDYEQFPSKGKVLGTRLVPI